MIRQHLQRLQAAKQRPRALLRERGFKVRRLEDGFPEWKAAGLPHASTAAAS